MPSTIPFLTIVLEILRHTPMYAWGVLALLIALGSRQMRDHVITRTRLAIVPIALGAFSLWGATMAFGGRAEIVVAWLFGIGVALVANGALRWPRRVGPVAGGYAVGGSPWPLVTLLTIFGLRYAVAITLAFHHELAADAVFSGAIALLYGALSGLFVARALRILRSGASSVGYAPA